MMRAEPRYNPLANFDFSLLDNPEFKEDSVREEMIVPILKALGYSASGNNRIIRSRRLIHPFVSIGNRRKEISIVPDYVLEMNDNPVWILEAKAPSQTIFKSPHVEQAYSYAIHPEIRAKYYALCNGNEFLVYSVDDCKPVFRTDLRVLAIGWTELKTLLSPETLEKNIHKKQAKDLGLHIKCLGFNEQETIVFLNLPWDFIAQIDSDLYTTSLQTTIDGCDYCASFDFDSVVASRLKGKIPDDVLAMLLQPLEAGRVKQVEFANHVFRIGVECVLSEKMQENKNEIFLPLKITNIF